MVYKVIIPVDDGFKITKTFKDEKEAKEYSRKNHGTVQIIKEKRAA